MRKVARAAIAAAVLGCVSPDVMAQEERDPHWLTDPVNNCALYDANAKAGDEVTWNGGCSDGYASGEGTAAFTNNGAAFESFTGTFAQGVAQDGHVVVHWGQGWTYDGNNAHGQFNGAGVLTNDKNDRFEGNWIDGKMNGPGVLTRANGERYEGDWKDDLPNGQGVLKRADGTTVQGIFAAGKLVTVQSEAPVASPPPVQAAAAEPMVQPKPVKVEAPKPSKPEVAKSEAVRPQPVKQDSKTPGPPPRGFDRFAGKNLSGVDGSRITLSSIEGGVERQITPAGGAPQKTTFTFLNDRLGTVVEDGGPAAGANVTGFFRLTDTGVEVRYADGRSEILTASEDGGLRMALNSASGEASCRAFYPEGHVFSEEEKKAALAAYAARLGLQASPAKPSSCPSSAAAAAPAPQPPLAARKAAPAKPAPSHTAFHPTPAPTRGKIADLQTVAVRESVVHTIDAMDGGTQAPLTPAPVLSGLMPSGRDPSQCLKVESDGAKWGFRNQCDFAVQFSYCRMKGGERLTDCGDDNALNSVGGSVAAKGFGALTADNSLAEKNVDHDYRWVACAGGAGEVVAHLDHADPPSGHCDRAETASAH